MPVKLTSRQRQVLAYAAAGRLKQYPGTDYWTAPTRTGYAGQASQAARTLLAAGLIRKSEPGEVRAWLPAVLTDAGRTYLDSTSPIPNAIHEVTA